MKVKMYKQDSLIIVPETEFEEQYLNERYFDKPINQFNVWLKHGASTDSLVGLVIEKETKEKENENN